MSTHITLKHVAHLSSACVFHNMQDDPRSPHDVISYENDITSTWEGDLLDPQGDDDPAVTAAAEFGLTTAGTGRETAAAAVGAFLTPPAAPSAKGKPGRPKAPSKGYPQGAEVHVVHIVALQVQQHRTVCCFVEWSADAPLLKTFRQHKPLNDAILILTPNTLLRKSHLRTLPYMRPLLGLVVLWLFGVSVFLVSSSTGWSLLNFFSLVPQYQQHLVTLLPLPVPLLELKHPGGIRTSSCHLNCGPHQQSRNAS